MLKRPARKQSVLAATPIAAYTIVLIVSWLWPAHLFTRTVYPVAGLGLLALLGIGTLWGMVRRLPMWSYTWVVFFVAELFRLASAAIASNAHSAVGFGIELSLVDLASLVLWGILVGFLSLRGVRFGMLAILLVLTYQALRLPFVSGGPGISASPDTPISWVFVAVAAGEAMLAILFVNGFLFAGENHQRRYLYLLAALIFVAPLFRALWAVALVFRGGGMGSEAITMASIIGGAWIGDLVTLLLTWAVSKAVLRRVGNRVPTTVG